MEGLVRWCNSIIVTDRKNYKEYLLFIVVKDLGHCHYIEKIAIALEYGGMAGAGISLLTDHPIVAGYSVLASVVGKIIDSTYFKGKVEVNFGELEKEVNKLKDKDKDLKL